MEVKELNLLLHNAAVLYVLQNCDESLPFIQEPYQEEQMQCTNTNANLDDNHEDETDWSRTVEDNSHNMDVE
ncbi:hypothetical protein QYF36_017016 [Acer negundo]|nr:hypothetical protein QYF36_017016 [Acer negundo]